MRIPEGFKFYVNNYCQNFGEWGSSSNPYFLLSFGNNSQLKMVVKIERRKAPTIADQKLVMEKPGDIVATISRAIAFITKRNRPNVIIVIGKAMRFRIGFTIAFTRPRISAATIMEGMSVK